MNLIILEESERVKNSLFCLNQRKSLHVLKILKASLGEEVKVGLLNDSIGKGIIQNIDSKKKEVTLQYVKEFKREELPKPKLQKVKIFSAIQRPQTVKKMIQLSATCGLEEIFFFPAEKSEYSYLNSSIWTKENLLEEIILGLEQGSRVLAPNVVVLKNKFRIKEFLREENRFLLDFNSKYLLDQSISIQLENSNSFVIGPESGLTKEDLEYFLNLNFQKITVSENVLRSENALSYLLAQLELLKSLSS